MADNRFKRILRAVLGTDSKPPKLKAFSGSYQNIFSVSYNGEKNLGEIGPIKDYYLDYEALRMRSWQSYLESEIAKTVLDKFTLWMVSSGLKLQANPMKVVLESEDIKLESTEAFNEVAEARFTVWAKSSMSDYAGMSNLNLIAQEAFKNAKIGGDVLVIIRYIKKQVKVQIIDGSHLCSSSIYGTDGYAPTLQNGNTMRHGIEINAQGEHVAYHVRTKDYKTERIEARSKSTGLRTAFLVYGNKYRIDNYRGIPLIAACMETLKKLERYKEAAVGSAEERQKIVMQIVHQNFSTGENPLLKQLAKAVDADADTDDLPVDINGNQLADTVAATTNKSTYNMPIGAELKSLESKNEMFFKEFYGTNSDIICGAVGIPPNVAFSIYNDSFSASRAATKDWEHTITVNRENFAFQFYKPIYDFWLHIQILQNKLSAPGYLEAAANQNDMVLEAYRNARFTGPMFPHIDPLKEVKAEREKLGSSGAHIPLTTVEQATEVLNGGDSDSNILQFAEELKMTEQAGIKPAAPMQAEPPAKKKTEEEE